MMFKKISMIFTILTLAFAASHAQAQYSRLKYNKKKEHTKPWFQMTPVVGFGVTNLETQKYSEANNQMTIKGVNSTSGGFLIDMNSHKVGLALQTGLIYQQNQYDIEVNSLASGVNAQLKAESVDQTLNIPIMAKYYPFSPAGKWFYVRGGLNLSYLMDTQDKTTMSFTDPNSSQVLESRTEENSGTVGRTRFDVQGVAGLGVAIPFSKSIGLFVEGNYQYGFLDTIDKSETGGLSIGGKEVEHRTRAVQGLLGLSISL